MKKLLTAIIMCTAALCYNNECNAMKKLQCTMRAALGSFCCCSPNITTESISPAPTTIHIDSTIIENLPTGKNIYQELVESWHSNRMFFKNILETHGQTNMCIDDFDVDDEALKRCARYLSYELQNNPELAYISKNGYKDCAEKYLDPKQNPISIFFSMLFKQALIEKESEV